MENQEKNELTSFKQNTTNNLPQRIEALSLSAEKFRLLPSEPSDERWTPVKKVLFQASIKIGLHDPLTSAELMELCRFVSLKYKDININELNEAFDLYCSKELEFKDNPYNKLSNLFLGDILSSFRKYRSHQFTKLKKEGFKETETDPSKYLEEELFKKYDKLMNEEKYLFSHQDERFLHGKLFRMGIDLKPSEEISETFKKKAEQVVGHRLKSKEKQLSELRGEYKEYCFKNWITLQAETKQNIRELIEFLTK